MKKILKVVSYTCLSLFLYACSSQTSHNSLETTEHAANQINLPYATGEITHAQLFARYSRFASNYNKYQPSEDDVKQVASIDKPLSLHIVFGTWCHDSEREIPRLLKLLHQANNPNITYQMIAVGYNKKVSDVSDLPVSIKYTPTVIITDESGTELTRVIERPEGSWGYEVATTSRL